MGQEGSRFEASDADSALLREFKHLKGGKKRLSTEDFAKEGFNKDLNKTFDSPFNFLHSETNQCSLS